MATFTAFPAYNLDDKKMEPYPIYNAGVGYNEAARWGSDLGTKLYPQVQGWKKFQSLGEDTIGGVLGLFGKGGKGFYDQYIKPSVAGYTDRKAFVLLEKVISKIGNHFKDWGPSQTQAFLRGFDESSGMGLGDEQREMLTQNLQKSLAVGGAGAFVPPEQLRNQQQMYAGSAAKGRLELSGTGLTGPQPVTTPYPMADYETGTGFTSAQQWILQPDRQVPYTEPGWRVWGGDNMTTPIPEFLGPITNVRLPPQEEKRGSLYDIQWTERDAVTGDIPPLDVNDLRLRFTTPDGIYTGVYGTGREVALEAKQKDWHARQWGMYGNRESQASNNVWERILRGSGDKFLDEIFGLAMKGKGKGGGGSGGDDWGVNKIMKYLGFAGTAAKLGVSAVAIPGIIAAGITMFPAAAFTAIVLGATAAWAATSDNTMTAEEAVNAGAEYAKGKFKAGTAGAAYLGEKLKEQMSDMFAGGEEHPNPGGELVPLPENTSTSPSPGETDFDTYLENIAPLQKFKTTKDYVAFEGHMREMWRSMYPALKARGFPDWYLSKNMGGIIKTMADDFIPKHTYVSSGLNAEQLLEYTRGLGRRMGEKGFEAEYNHHIRPKLQGGATPPEQRYFDTLFSESKEGNHPIFIFELASWEKIKESIRGGQSDVRDRMQTSRNVKAIMDEYNQYVASQNPKASHSIDELVQGFLERGQDSGGAAPTPPTEEEEVPMEDDVPEPPPQEASSFIPKSGGGTPLQFDIPKDPFHFMHDVLVESETPAVQEEHLEDLSTPAPVADIFRAPPDNQFRTTIDDNGFTRYAQLHMGASAAGQQQMDPVFQKPGMTMYDPNSQFSGHGVGRKRKGFEMPQQSPNVINREFMAGGGAGAPILKGYTSSEMPDRFLQMPSGTGTHTNPILTGIRNTPAMVAQGLRYGVDKGIPIVRQGVQYGSRIVEQGARQIGGGIASGYQYVKDNPWEAATYAGYGAAGLGLAFGPGLVPLIAGAAGAAITGHHANYYREQNEEEANKRRKLFLGQ